MLLSLYTCVKDGIFHDYHVAEMLRHHLSLADEIIVNDGLSTDGTYELIGNIDPKIKVFRSDWGHPKDLNWITNFKNDARSKCTGEWCINIDCDEFIPEWEFSKLRDFLRGAKELIYPLQIINFYGNYKVFHKFPAKVPWPDWKKNVHKNLPEIEVFGDGSNVRVKNQDQVRVNLDEAFPCHHFGFVRNPARLREKWRNVLANLYIGSGKSTRKKNWFTLPSFLFNWWPHKWKDSQFLPDLAIYEGPYVAAVRNNPQEFIRDKMALYDHLTRQNQAVARS